MDKRKSYFLKKGTVYLTRVAVLAALSVVFNCFSVPLGANNSNSLSLVFIPAFIAGIFLGPAAGAIVGFTGDFLGGIIMPKGAYLPLLGVGNMMMGLIPGLIFKIKKLNPIIGIVIAFVLYFVTCTMGVNTYAIWSVYSKSPFLTYMLPRVFPIQLINTAANLAVMIILYQSKALHRVFIKTERTKMSKPEIPISNPE